MLPPSFILQLNNRCPIAAHEAVSMKKIWSFILCLVISLAMTSVCLASDGADLNKQQQAVVKVFAALNGQNGMEYAGIRQLMSAKLQTELDEKTFGSVKNNLRRSYGEQRENRFLAYQRYADGDRLAYPVSYTHLTLPTNSLV